MLKRLVLIIGLILAFSGSVLAQSSPSSVVENFLQRWDAQDYDGMYDLIYVYEISGQPEYPRQTFVNRYQVVTERLSLTGITYSIRDTEIQGQSAIVSYDITLETSSFGTIDDPGRTMRLVNYDGTWRVAWTTMDIFSALSSDAQVRVESQPSTRATIYDRNGLPLAQDNQTTTALYSARSSMTNEEDCFNILAELLMEPRTRVDERASAYIGETIFFLGEMPTDIFERNRTRIDNVCNLQYTQTSFPHRVYYGGGALVSVTGYTSQVSPEEEATYGAGQLIGRAGVESAYQRVLAGDPSRVVRIVESGGLVLDELAGTVGTQSAPVTLTIDRDLQMIVARAMNDAFNYATPHWGGVSPGGAAVVLDVNTGEILALVSYPMFNPSLYNPGGVTPDRGSELNLIVNSARGVLRNRAVSEQFSPGSVFKLITAGAALNEGLIAPGEIYDCKLSWDGTGYGDTQPERLDWRATLTDEGYDEAGPITAAQAIMASCNPFFYEFGTQLYLNVGAGEMAAYAERMGILPSYGVVEDGYSSLPFNTQARGVITVPTNVEIAINEAIGQGDVAVSPLHMAVVTASIANGGTVYRPYMVQSVGTNGELHTFEPEVISTFDFEPGVLEEIQEGMCGVTTVEGMGTAYGRFVSIDDSNDSPFAYTDVSATYSSCAKTGTAQTAANANAWFVIYAPADDPQIAVAVMIEQSLEGSQVAAPIARRILDDYFNAPRASYPDWWAIGPFTPLPTGAQAG